MDTKKAPVSMQAAHGHGDIVTLNFFDSGKIPGCEIVAAHFTKSKVTYDVAIFVTRVKDGDEKQEQWTIISDVDSAFIED